MREQLRDINRRKADLSDIAGKLEMARRNSMTLDALRERLKVIEEGLRERARLLHEYAEDLIADAKAITKQKSKED